MGQGNLPRTGVTATTEIKVVTEGMKLLVDRLRKPVTPTFWRIDHQCFSQTVPLKLYLLSYEYTM